jgi:hypothetical protein
MRNCNAISWQRSALHNVLSPMNHLLVNTTTTCFDQYWSPSGGSKIADETTVLPSVKLYLL